MKSSDRLIVARPEDADGGPMATPPAPTHVYSWDFDFGLGPWTSWLAPSVVTEPGGTVEQFTRLQAPGPLDYNHIDGIGAIWLVAHLSTPTLGSPGVLNLHDAEFQMTVRGTDFDINGGQLVLWATRYVPETGVTEGFYFGLQVTNWANTGSDMAGQITDDWVTITLQISDDPADWTYAGNQESLEGDWADRYVPFDLGQTLSAIDATLHLVVLNADPDAAPTGFLDLSNITVRTQTPAVPDGLGGTNPEVHYGLEDQVATGMLAGDPAVNMAEAVFSLVGGSAANGVAVIDPDTGAFTFTPPADFFGPSRTTGYATFQYTVSDGAVTSDPITVVVYVGGINDAPVISARAEAVEIAGGQPFAHTLFSGSDVDMNRLGFEIVAGSVVGGTVALDAHSGRYTFTPTAGFSGAASFRYLVTDGQLESAEKQVELTVLPSGQQPAALTFDDAEAMLIAGNLDGWTHAVVRLADAGDANAGYHYGTWLADGINGIARDKAMARHYLELAENIVPDANLQLATLYSSGEGGTRDYARARELLEALPENRTAIYRLATLDDLGLGAPQDRQRAVEGYIEAARLGSAEAAYTLGRRYLMGEGVTASAEDAYFWLGVGLKLNAAPGIPIFLDLLTLNMGTAAESLTGQQVADLDAAILAWDAGEATPVNDAPLLGGADTVVGQAIPGATVSGTLARGTDPDGERPTFSLVPGSVANGTLVLDPDTGAFTFTPTAGFTGTGSFDYRVTDSQANSAVRTISFAVEVGTEAISDLGGTAEDTPLSVGVAAGLLANDFAAPSGGSIAVSAVAGLAGNVGTAVAGSWGSLTVQADGSWLYTPAAGARALLEGQVVTDTFAYTITDQSGRSSTSTLVVTVNGRDGTVLNGSGVLIGSAFGDEITGGTGSDILLGLGGDDRLVGGSGSTNELYGGTGNDTYVVSNTGDSVIENPDSGTDIVLSSAAAHTLGAHVENLTYTGTTGFTGVGNGLANVIVGGTASDLLIGLGGNDTLVGGTGGANEMYGGTGDDLYIVASAGDTLVESAGEGTDTVQTALAAYTLVSAHIENLTFTGTGGFVGTGNAAANSIIGGQGDDRLAGRGGIDTLAGGLGSDTADYSAAAGAVTAHLGNGTTTQDGDGASDILSGIENLTGSAFDDLLTGDGAANVLTGGLGRDTLQGLAGADVLIGGTGLANQMRGGTGDDRYIVSAVGDTLIELAGEGIDTVETTLDRLTLAAELENLSFTGTDSFTGIGNGLANVITGGTSRDVLLGLAGNDTLVGGAGAANELYGGTGDDTYVISAVGDTIVEAAGEGFDTVQTTLSAYTLRNEVEALTFIGSGGFTGTGSAQANTLTGGAGDDILAGRGGIDRLVGGSGADTASYAAAAAGVDVRLNGTAPAARNDGDGATDILISIENLTGSAFDDLLVGDNGANVLSGGLGRDTLLGLGGNDRLIGGSGVANQLQGGQGDDTYVLTVSDTVVELVGEGIDTVETTLAAYTLGTNVENLAYLGTGGFTGTGNAAANTLTGGSGADVLRGLGGDDILQGGAGNDVAVLQGLQADYLIQAIDGGYRLTDRTAGRDGVDLLFGMESVRFANGATVALSSLQSAPVLAGKDFGPLVLPGEDEAVVADPAHLFGVSPQGRLAPLVDEISDLARPVTPWDDWS
jgi:VCBS repeat-containing protein